MLQNASRARRCAGWTSLFVFLAYGCRALSTGFGGDGALANDAAHAAQSVLKGQTQDDAARAQALADEYGAAVMILRNAGTPEALAGMEYQTLADGGRLYAVTQTVYQQLQGSYADAEMTAPQTETHNDTAYVLLIP